VRVRARPLTAGEERALRRLASSRTASARAVERARIVWLSAGGRPVGEIARAVGRTPETVRAWIKRFNERGQAGLGDAARGGRPARYTAEQVGAVIELALSDPGALDLPFGCWTLGRLQGYANEVLGIPIRRARIGALLLKEGLRWRQQESWFGQRVDPQFAEKRGPSSGSTPSRRPAARSSAWTSSARRRPRASAAGAPSARAPRTAGRAAPRRKSTTGGGARATSSAPSGRPTARP
jgi:transposase